ncbi:hypothetical protein PPACK8108_LOCUS17088 [Phakopsora pachyrhizi]|uniref:Uncharacterized protein n=1 Tax=Phakopsora pachyrhizi TaxID=170000 RepID=A0AAV0BDY4_PHAPC|nr:hypothetical protein PPACK8108_LOCUS17088 [Phakopsora pachyrhizi]
MIKESNHIESSDLSEPLTEEDELSRNSQGTVDEVKKQIELGLLGSSKGRIQLVVLMNLHLKFRNKERTKEIQDLRGNPLDNEEERSFKKSNPEDQGLMKTALVQFWLNLAMAKPAEKYRTALKH